MEGLLQDPREVRRRAAGCRVLKWGGAAEGPSPAARAKVLAGAQPGRPENVSWVRGLLGRAWCFKEDQGCLGEERRRAPEHGEGSCRWPEWEGRKGWMELFSKLQTKQKKCSL